MSKRRAKAKKLPWVDMTVTRVKLNAEQAVLSCCNLLNWAASASDVNS